MIGTSDVMWGFSLAQSVKNLPVQETQVQSLSREDPLEKEMASHSSTLAWRIPWTEEPGGLHGVAKSQTRLKQLAHTCTTCRRSELVLETANLAISRCHRRANDREDREVSGKHRTLLFRSQRLN